MEEDDIVISRVGNTLIQERETNQWGRKEATSPRLAAKALVVGQLTVGNNIEQYAMVY